MKEFGFTWFEIVANLVFITVVGYIAIGLVMKIFDNDEGDQ